MEVNVSIDLSGYWLVDDRRGRDAVAILSGLSIKVHKKSALRL